nr:hypothetical protein [Skermania piniformis]
MTATRDIPVVGGLIRRNLVVIRYHGRRSGTTYETPVNFRRSGDRIVIGVMAADSKQWWRNFTGDGGPITLLDLDGRDRTGHAVATRGDGGVRVTVQLDS